MNKNSIDAALMAIEVAANDMLAHVQDTTGHEDQQVAIMALRDKAQTAVSEGNLEHLEILVRKTRESGAHILEGRGVEDNDLDAGDEIGEGIRAISSALEAFKNQLRR